MKSQNRIIPDLYQQDFIPEKITESGDPATEEDDGRKTMFETINKFTEGRRAYKKKIISDVMAAAFPNIEGKFLQSLSLATGPLILTTCSMSTEFNVTEFVEGRKILPKPNKCVR